ncbi:CYFA0S02e08658g1_1 [Cyberlindnera fabianii]|uniref:CYFA0S02e08658g1_1 n=1 Tax=Cyberlindnera fabianii TaxID=36022 RepID=A0A061AU88_CYBFA|nr:CYFA0S02e08658g1_1 [Cyberlindnera fabianii]
MLVTFEAKKSNKNNSVPSSSTSSSTASSLISTKKTVPATSNNEGQDDDPIIHNLDSANPPDDKVFHFTKKKLRGGCITCKIRKKRCTEERPICSDCKRLEKNCVWATEDMSNETVRELKRKVEEEENSAKKRRFEKLDNKKNRTGQIILENTFKSGVPRSQPSSSINKQEPQRRARSVQLENGDEDEAPLDTEAQFPGQTPVSANLLHFPRRSQHFGANVPHTAMESTSPLGVQVPDQQQSSSSQPPSFSPKWDMNDAFAEFKQLFESNIRNNISKYSDKITNLDINDTSNQQQQQNRNSNNTQLIQTKASPNPFEFLSQGSSPVFDFVNLMDIPTSNPQIFIPSELDLDPMGVRLFDYYRNRLAGIISIVPDELNYYTKVFLPMAMVNPGILYSIMAWSGYHMGGEFLREGEKYMEKALDHINATPVKSDSDALQRLANLLIMIGAEICKGDVRKWPVFLQWGAKIINDRGGLYKFNADKEQHWLISSFAYHDILASSTSERGTYFSVEDYDNFIVNFGFGVDPLQGIVKPLFNIIGEISTLATETKTLLKISSNSLGYGIMNDDEEDPNLKNDAGDDTDIPGLDDTPDSIPDQRKKYTRYSSLLQIMQKASVIESKINNAKPSPQDLEEFNDSELELQLTLFELFQLTAKLHLRQSVLRLNPSSLETQFILCELLKCLDIVLKSTVESSLCFPLFIAGMNCTTKKDRRMMLERFQDIIERYSFKNLERAKTIMEQVWLIDPSGTRCVDWYEIVKRLGWDISFA